MYRELIFLRNNTACVVSRFLGHAKVHSLQDKHRYIMSVIASSSIIGSLGMSAVNILGDRNALPIVSIITGHTSKHSKHLMQSSGLIFHD